MAATKTKKGPLKKATKAVKRVAGKVVTAAGKALGMKRTRKATKKRSTASSRSR